MGNRTIERQNLDVDTRLLLLEGDTDVVEAKLNGILKGIWALVVVVTAGVLSFIFSLIQAGLSQ